MKKIFVLPSFAILLFVSCQTVPLETPDISEYAAEASYSKPPMEFIGFKASADTLSTSTATVVITRDTNFVKTTTTNISSYDSWRLMKNDSIIGKFGAKLEDKNFAADKSYAYFGIYSLQELELYKSQTRYITFVQVNKNNLTWDGKDSRAKWGALGVTYLGTGIVFNALGSSYPSRDPDGSSNSSIKSAYNVVGAGFDLAGVIMLCAGAGQKITTKFDYTGDFDIFIYDTENKEVLKRYNIPVQCSQNFNGFYQDSDKTKVANFFGTYVSNTLLKQYEEILKELKLNNN